MKTIDEVLQELNDISKRQEANLEAELAVLRETVVIDQEVRAILNTNPSPEDKKRLIAGVMSFGIDSVNRHDRKILAVEEIAASSAKGSTGIPAKDVAEYFGRLGSGTTTGGGFPRLN